MAKKPNLTVVGGPRAADAKPGHNSSGLTDDQVQALTRQHSEKRAHLLELEKTAKANRMNFDKVIKSDLGAKGLADIKLLAELETEEGETKFKEEMERQARVARWAGLHVGMQGSLFDEDRRPIADRAYEEGKRAGLAGKDAKPPHAPGTEAHNEWMRGWHDGQAVLAAGFKKKEPQSELVKSEDPKPPSGPDDFDHSASAGGDG
jgi:ribosome modulation factor